MPTVPPAVPGSNREQQIAYYAGILDQFAAQNGISPTYQGTYAKFHGLTWGVFYTQVADQNPKVDPKQLGDAFIGLEAAQKLGEDLSTPALGKFLTAAEKAAADTNFAAGVPGAGLLSGISAIGDFFARLTEANTWIRIGEFLIGAMLIISGVLHFSGKSADIKDIAGTALKVIK